MMKNKLFIECECLDPSHLMYIQYDSYYDEIIINNQMNHYLPWYKRIYVAIKFIFKLKNKYNSHWDCTMINEEKRLKLKEFLENCKKD